MREGGAGGGGGAAARATAEAVPARGRGKSACLPARLFRATLYNLPAVNGASQSRNLEIQLTGKALKEHCEEGVAISPELLLTRPPKNISSLAGPPTRTHSLDLVCGTRPTMAPMSGTKALAVLTLLAVATQVAGTRSLLADTLSGR